MSSPRTKQWHEEAKRARSEFKLKEDWQALDRLPRPQYIRFTPRD